MLDQIDVQISSSLKRVNGEVFAYPEGRRNSLLVDTLEVLAPYRAPDSLLLYVEDKGNHLYVYEHDYLTQLGTPCAFGDLLADVVLYQPQQNTLYFLYAVSQFGPLLERRRDETERLLARCSAQRVYVSVMYNRFDYTTFAPHIVWGTHVWLSELPEHSIHHA